MNCKAIHNSSSIMSIIFLLYLILCEINLTIAWSPALNPSVSHRKPPFNGSIFGKRSIIPAKEGLQEGLSLDKPTLAIKVKKPRPESSGLMQPTNEDSVHRCLSDYHKFIQLASSGECCLRKFYCNGDHPINPCVFRCADNISHFRAAVLCQVVSS